MSTPLVRGAALFLSCCAFPSLAFASDQPASSSKSAAAPGKQTYRISTSGTPKFTEAVIDPEDVHVGDVQQMSVTLEDPDGITSVIAEVQTDTGKKRYTLKRVSGIYTSGQWSGTWKVHDAHSDT